MPIMSDASLQALYQNAAMILTAVGSLIAAWRSNRAARASEKNLKEIEKGNEIAAVANAKVDVANAKVDVVAERAADFHDSFTTKIDGLSEISRREANEALKAVTQTLRAEIERDVASEIAEMRHEIIRLNDLVIRLQPQPAAKPD